MRRSCEDTAAATTYRAPGSLDCGRTAQRRPPGSSVLRRDSPPAAGPCLRSLRTGPTSSCSPPPSYQGTLSASPPPGRPGGQFGQQNAGKIKIKYLHHHHTITVMYLCEVAKFQVPVSHPGAFPWIHHLHDDLQESRLTSSVLSHDTDPGLHGGGQINVGEYNSKHFPQLELRSSRTKYLITWTPHYICRRLH